MKEESQEIDLSKYPRITELEYKKGKKEGDIQIFSNGNIGEAYMWHVDGSYWERIGEVVGAKAKEGAGRKIYEGDRFFPQGEYDYIFDVDLGENITKRLPYNNNQNPLETAEKFITREGMGRGYVQEITKFINDNARPSFNAPAPKPQQTSSKFFPQAVCLTFQPANLAAIISKIKEFNVNVSAPHQLDDVELRCLDKISGILSSKSTTSSLTVKDLDLLVKLLHWPRNVLFPCLDLYRVALLHHYCQEIFKTSDHGAEHIGFLVGIIANSINDNPILITGLKVLCNMFDGNSSQYSMETRRELVLDGVLVHVENTNKNVRLGLITLLFNYTVRIGSIEDITGRIQILAAFNEILQNEKDNDNLLRSFTAIGNIITGGGTIRKDVISTLKELGLFDTINSLKCTDKANECRLDLINLLR